VSNVPLQQEVGVEASVDLAEWFGHLGRSMISLLWASRYCAAILVDHATMHLSPVSYFSRRTLQLTHRKSLRAIIYAIELAYRFISKPGSDEAASHSILWDPAHLR
jgi:hypothetical protein